METRGQTQQLSDVYGSFLRGGAGPNSRMGRLTSGAVKSTLGFDPRSIGIDSAVMAGLMDPASATSNLMASLMPFEAEETGRQVAGLRNMFGTVGGRFGRNMGEAEGNLRAQLANQFARTRAESIIGATAQRNQFLAQLLPMIGQQSMMPFQLMNQFLAPGQAYFQEGLAPGLIGGAANIGAMLALGPAGPAAIAAAGAAGGGKG